MKKLLITATLLLLLALKPLFAQVEDGVDIRKVQRILTTLCYKPGPIDGLWGKRTANAVAEFFADEKKEYEGKLDKSEAEFIFTRAAVINGLGKSKKCKSVVSKQNNKSSKKIALTAQQKSLLRCGAKLDDLIHLENVQIFDGCLLPEYPGQNISEQTLHLYLRMYLSWERFGKNHYESKPSKNPRVFKEELKEFPYLTKQLETTGLISYLYASDGQLIVDQKTPAERFGGEVKDNSKLWGASVAKSMTAYLVGNAICKGYIGSVEETLSDWQMLEGTLYENARIIDLLNMRAGDQQHADSNGLKASGIHINNKVLGHIIDDELKNTEPGRAKYNYNELPPLLLLNYVIHKTGKNFQSLLDYSFRDLAKTKHSVFFQRRIWSEITPGNLVRTTKRDYQAQPVFYATRHDYLRIAQSMLDAWNNDDCLGDYLKTLYENRKSKGKGHRSVKPFDYSTSLFKSYGGFFHTDYQGLRSRNIMQMHGYGGQHVWIDFDNSRIVATNSIHQNFNWKRLIADVIKSGKLR